MRRIPYKSYNRDSCIWNWHGIVAASHSLTPVGANPQRVGLLIGPIQSLTTPYFWITTSPAPVVSPFTPLGLMLPLYDVYEMWYDYWGKVVQSQLFIANGNVNQLSLTWAEVIATDFPVDSPALVKGRPYA